MHIPSYRKHKASGQAVVTLNGRDHYLGKYGTAASRAEYDRLVALWIGGGRQPLGKRHRDTTVDEVILAFWRWATSYYVKAGKPTAHLRLAKHALKDLSRFWGMGAARDFGPSKLTFLQSHWVNEGKSRDLVNRRTKVVRQAFAWGASRELVGGEVYQALRTVRGLAKGRTTARETPGVTTVPEAHVEAVLDVLEDSHVGALIRLQLLTGMRPGEAVDLRMADVERSGDVWTYRPRTHKTEHHGKERTIYFGPRAIMVLGPFANLLDGSTPFRTRQGRPITVDSYRRAIIQACRHAGVPVWHPNQLRHNYATRIRAALGLEASRVMLGHGRVETTQIYAERDEQGAKEVARRFG